MNLRLPALELVENGLSLGTDVQLGRVVHEEDDVSPVNEPLAGIVEGEHARHLLPHFQDTGDFYDIHLRRNMVVFKERTMMRNVSVSQTYRKADTKMGQNKPLVPMV